MSQIQETINTQKAFIQTGATISLRFRLEALRTLEKGILSHTNDIIGAVQADCMRPSLEIYTSEIIPVLAEINLAIKNLKKWSKKTSYKVSNLVKPASSYSKPQAHGSILIIGPWNYPFNLLVLPLVSSIAAGNATILKPSEISPHTAQYIKVLFSALFPANFITTILGGAEIVHEIIQAGVNFIFFTGGIKAGNSIMFQASRHITPLVLELGGKCPCLIDNPVNIDSAARAIVWAKFFNAGQTCIAPDYCLVSSAIMDRFIQSLKNIVRTFYGSDPQKSSSYSRIINDHHFERICALLKQGNIIDGGTTDRKTRYIAPTLMINVPEGSSILHEEIFGPILPIVKYTTIDEAVAFIKGRPQPLTAYVFSKDHFLQERLIERLSIGNIVINATMHFMLAKGAPFGGTGTSGFGRYHGKAGFDTFSTTKTVFRKSFVFDNQLLYPPYRFPYRFVNWLRKLIF